MPTFATARDAKEFLISRLVAEAQRLHIPLSEIETKSMYFSESAWTLPDMTEVSEAFEREYEPVEYEQKIGKLADSFRSHARQSAPDELKTWDQAVRQLAREDHYLLVLIRAGKGAVDSALADRLKLVNLAFVIVMSILAAIYLFAQHQ